MVSWTVKNYSHNAQQENKISSHCSLAVSLKLASSALCGLLRPNITYSAALARAKQLNFPFAVTLAIVNRVKHRKSDISMAHKMPQSTLSTIFRRAFLRVSDEWKSWRVQWSHRLCCWSVEWAVGVSSHCYGTISDRSKAVYKQKVL